MTACQHTTCEAPADVTVEESKGAQTLVCWRHLLRKLMDARRQVRAFRRLDWEPKCFQPSCDAHAVAIAYDEDDAPLPACQQHFDDLSWITLPEPLLSDEPGWSRG